MKGQRFLTLIHSGHAELLHICLNTRPGLFLQGQCCQESSENGHSLSLERLVKMRARARVPRLLALSPLSRAEVGLVACSQSVVSSSSSPLVASIYGVRTEVSPIRKCVSNVPKFWLLYCKFRVFYISKQCET